MYFSWLLIAALIIEAVLLTWLGVSLSRHGVAAIIAMVIPIAIAAAWRAGFVALSFWLSGAWRDRTLTQRFALWRGETQTMLWLYSIAMPLAMITTAWRKRHPAPKDATKPVIVLVHGFMCNSGMWAPIQKALQQAGMTQNFLVSLDPFYRDSEANKRALMARIERICTRTGATQVTLIGHSMGGLLSRVLLHQYPHRIAKVISIGAPHAGTDAARWVSSIHAGPVRPDTKWLVEFNRACETSPHPKNLLNIWSSADNIVYPQANASLSTDDIKLTDVGHLALTADPRTAQHIIRFLSSDTP
jgi:triacylglycerol lipase